jgi:hypothetical protein
MTEKTAFRVLVTGSRHCSDRELVSNALNAVLREFGPFTLIHGNCPTGADEIAHHWALENGQAIEFYPANWIAYGRRAGPERNTLMVSKGADLCLVFALPHGGSHGTEDCARKAKAAKIPIRRFEVQRGDAAKPRMVKGRIKSVGDER